MELPLALVLSHERTKPDRKYHVLRVHKLNGNANVIIADMAWATYVLHVVQVLAWPIVVIIFRKEIIALLGRLTKASAGGVSLEFQKEAEQAKTQLQGLRLESLLLEAPADRTLRYQGQGTRVEIDEASSYVGQVIRAWARIENLAIEFAERLDIVESLNSRLRRPNVRRVMEALHARGLISAEVLEIVKNLQGMRNRLAHDPDVIGVSAAEALLSAIRELEQILLMAGANIGK